MALSALLALFWYSVCIASAVDSNAQFKGNIGNQGMPQQWQLHPRNPTVRNVINNQPPITNMGYITPHNSKPIKTYTLNSIHTSPKLENPLIDNETSAEVSLEKNDDPSLTKTRANEQQPPEDKQRCMSTYNLQEKMDDENLAKRLKTEISNLQDLLQVLRDQQIILNILNDIEGKGIDNSNRIIEETLLKHLKKINDEEEKNSVQPPKTNKTTDENIEIAHLKHDIASLKSLMKSSLDTVSVDKLQNLIPEEEKLADELKSQQQEIMALKKIIMEIIPKEPVNGDGFSTSSTTMPSATAVTATTVGTTTEASSRRASRNHKQEVAEVLEQLNSIQNQLAKFVSDSNNTSDDERVGAFPVFAPRFSANVLNHTGIKNTLSKPRQASPPNPAKNNTNQSQRRSHNSDDVDVLLNLLSKNQKSDSLELLTDLDGDAGLSKILKSLGNEAKTDSLELDAETDLQDQLLDLQKALSKKSKKTSLEEQIKKLEKQIIAKDLESKTLSDDDPRTHLKKLQKAIEKMNKNTKVESKSTDDDDDIESGLRKLEKAIRGFQSDDEEDLDDAEEKKGNFQVMINKLIKHKIRKPKLTHTQIQAIRKKLIAMKNQASGSVSGYDDMGEASDETGHNGVDGHGHVHMVYFDDLNDDSSDGNYGANYKGYQHPVSHHGYAPHKSGTYQNFGGGLPYNGNHYVLNKFGYTQGLLNNNYGIRGYTRPNMHTQYGGSYNQNAQIKPSYNPSTNYVHSQPFYNNGLYPQMSTASYSNAPLISNYAAAAPNYNHISYTPANSYVPNLNNQYSNNQHIGEDNQAYQIAPTYTPPTENVPAYGSIPNAPDSSAYTNTAGYNGDNAYPQNLDASALYKPPVPDSNVNIHAVVDHSSDYNQNQFFQDPSYKAPSVPQVPQDSYKEAGGGFAPNTQEPYANPQPNSNGYTQEKVGDLKNQIYDLQNVINAFNKPENLQKPEDKETVYYLDKQINDLKTVVNNLSHDYGNGNANYQPPAPAYQNNPGNYQEVLAPNYDQNLHNVVNGNVNKNVYNAAPPSNNIAYANAASVDQNGYNNAPAATNKEYLPRTHHSQKHRREICNYELQSESASPPNKTDHNILRRDADIDESNEAINELTNLFSRALDSADSSRESSKSRIQPNLLEDVKRRVKSLQKQLDFRRIRNGPRESYYGNQYGEPKGMKLFKKDKDKDKGKDDIFDKIFDKIIDKVVGKSGKIVPKLVEVLFGVDKLSDFMHNDYGGGDDYGGGGGGYGGGGGGYGGGYHDDYALEKNFKGLGLAGFLPMILLKLLSKMHFFFSYLQKYKFFRTFLVPALILLLVAGAVIFLVWWLQPNDDYHEHIDYSGYNNHENNNYGNDYNGGGYNSYARSNGYNNNNYNPQYKKFLPYPMMRTPTNTNTSNYYPGYYNNYNPQYRSILPYPMYRRFSNSNNNLNPSNGQVNKYFD